MAKAHSTWTVLPHRPLEQLADNLWRAEGDVPGMPLKRVMTVARLGDGGLVIHNAVALDPAAMTQLDALGPVRWVLVPNGYHRLDAPAYKGRYPASRVLCPAGARQKVQEVVPVDGVYADFPADAAVRLHPLAGTRDAEGVMEVRSADGATLVFNDILFNMPHLPGVSGLVLRYVTQSSGGPRVSRIGRWFLIKDRPALRDQLRQLADTPALRRVVVSHHQVISDDPAAVLRQVADTLA